MANNPMLSVELRDEIILSFERHLRAQTGTLLDNNDVRDQLLDEIRSILDEIANSYPWVTEHVDPGPMSLSTEIGASEAIEGVLRAANVLFETAMPLVQRAFSAVGRSDAEATLVLHRVIMSSIASSAASHAGLTLKSIRDSHRAQLARLARNLHDRTAHALGVALQNIELHEVHASHDVARAQDKLHRAKQAMRQALDSVRYFSAELHTTIRPDKLREAITQYLAANAESNILTTVKVTGDTATLPEEVCSEVYVTIREAIRNALVHSGTTRLDVTVEVSKSRLLATVSDAGRGFSIKEATKAGEAIGLSSMQERVQLLGGTLRLSSLPGQGTTVKILIPLSRVLK